MIHIILKSKSISLNDIIRCMMNECDKNIIDYLVTFYENNH